MTQKEQDEALRRLAVSYGARVYGAWLALQSDSTRYSDKALVRVAVGRLRRTGGYGPTVRV